MHLQYIRELYWRYEYEEVVTPNIYNFDLWKTSGHAEHYKDNMFLINIEKQEFGLKPMNCPGAPRRAFTSHDEIFYWQMPARLTSPCHCLSLRWAPQGLQGLVSGVQRAQPDACALHALHVR